MTQFKAGDRVSYKGDGMEGTIHKLESHHGEDTAHVTWADGMDGPIEVGDLELVERQPNRSYYDSVRELQEDGYPPAEISFEMNVNRHLTAIENIPISKNKAYGDSALNPIRAFSKASRIEQLNVRIDDKISRIQRGTGFENEDTVRDLIGYLVLRLIAEESKWRRLPLSWIFSPPDLIRTRSD